MESLKNRFYGLLNHRLNSELQFQSIYEDAKETHISNSYWKRSSSDKEGIFANDSFDSSYQEMINILKRLLAPKMAQINILGQIIILDCMDHHFLIILNLIQKMIL